MQDALRQICITIAERAPEFGFGTLLPELLQDPTNWDVLLIGLRGLIALLLNAPARLQSSQKDAYEAEASLAAISAPLKPKYSAADGLLLKPWIATTLRVEAAYVLGAIYLDVISLIEDQPCGKSILLLCPQHLPRSWSALMCTRNALKPSRHLCKPEGKCSMRRKARASPQSFWTCCVTIHCRCRLLEWPI